jgi:phage tail-like protein
MPNRRDFDHIGNFNFKVEIEGVSAGAFQEVSGLEVVTEVIEYQDGDDRVPRKRPGRTSYSNIVLTKGYTATDALWEWMNSVISGTVERRSMAIALFGDDAVTEIVRYNVFNAWPCRWKGFALDGMGAGTAIEELEVVVEKIERA